MMQLSKEAQEQLMQMKKSLDKLESSIAPLLSLEHQETDALKQAQIHLAVAKATNALLQLYLRASGVDPYDHEAKKQTTRLAHYEKKVAKALGVREWNKVKRSMEVDVEVMNRFIVAAVPDLDQEQKQALKDIGAAKRKHQQGEGSNAVADDSSDKKKRPPPQQVQNSNAAMIAGGSHSKQQSNKKARQLPRDTALDFLQQTMAELNKERVGPVPRSVTHDDDDDNGDDE